MNAAPDLTLAVGWLGTALVILSYAQSNVRMLRIISMVASIVLVAFNVALGIWSNVALEIALVAINVARLRKRGDQRANTTAAAPIAVHTVATVTGTRSVSPAVGRSVPA